MVITILFNTWFVLTMISIIAIPVICIKRGKPMTWRDFFWFFYGIGVGVFPAYLMWLVVNQ
jgi:hypothetical protein